MTKQTSQAQEKAVKQEVGFDPVALGHRWAELYERFQKALLKYYDAHKDGDLLERNLDPFHLRPAIFKFWESAFEHPEDFAKASFALWQNNLQLWQENWQRFISGEEYTPHAEFRDKRFRNEAWQTNPYFRGLKEIYISTANWILQQVYKTDDLDPKTKEKLAFFTRQYVDALSPSNFPFSNPDVLEETLKTGGRNLIEGFENLIEDFERFDGNWSLSTTDKSAFQIGRNLATTKGSVVFENKLMQLIQYAPTTQEVYKTPLLVIPPWINKYYILDMREENSFVKWLTDQGHTVFIISWANPDETFRDVNFEDYLQDGVLDALAAIEEQTGEPSANVIGYCIGGTLLACALSYLKKTEQAQRVKSATFLTTLLDFQDAGDLGIFIDEDQIANIEEQMADKGYLDAAYMKATFSMLRANDLIWSFVVHNYLLGKDPFPFDLLFWNDDSVNLPAAMHSYYLRNMYLANKLIQKDKMAMLGQTIDLSQITVPAYFLSAREDHIAPWQSTYEGVKYLGGDAVFTLAASGHIAGVVNPPTKHKYCFWSGDKIAKDPHQWMEKAVQQDGSWWPHWQNWAMAYAGDKVPARKIKSEIEPAPGRYVSGQR